MKNNKIEEKFRQRIIDSSRIGDDDSLSNKQTVETPHTFPSSNKSGTVEYEYLHFDKYKLL